MQKVYTHYDNLKVTRNAPLEVIKAAFRVMAQKYHPDLNSSVAANNTMRILNEAWEVLSDPVKRQEHDKWIAAEEERLSNSHYLNTNTSEQVFKTGNFDFHYKTPPKTSPAYKQDNPRQDRGEAKFVKSRTSALVKLNLWLNNRYWLLSAIAISIVILFYCGMALLTIKENVRTAKSITELNAKADLPKPTATPTESVAISVPSNKSSPASRFSDTDSSGAAHSPNMFSVNEPLPKINNSNIILNDPERQGKTGYFKGAYRQPPSGLSRFTVDNQKGGGDAIARIYLNGTKPAARTIYVKAGDTFTAQELPPGNYYFRYRFVGSTKTYEADRIFPLQENRTEEGTSYSNVRVTLFKVKDGNMKTKEVSDDEF